MNKRIPIIIGLLFVCIAQWLLMTQFPPIRHFISRLENVGYDFQLRARVLTGYRTPKSPVIIIDIDDKSIQAGGRWPWPRSQLAALVDKLHQQGVAVIAFDIFFSEKQPNIAETLINTLTKRNAIDPTVKSTLENDLPLFDEDSIFIKSISSMQTILAYSFLPRYERQNDLPPPLLALTPDERKDLKIVTEVGYISNLDSIQQAAKGGGFINIFPDEDGIIRRAPLVMEYNGAVYPALALQTVLTFLSEHVTLVTPYYHDTKQLEGIQIGNHVIPLDSRGFVLIPFVGRSYTFPYYSAIDVLQDKIPPGVLLGKIAFIGTSATGLGDLQPTSIQNPFPGVEIQATLADGILTHNFSYKPAWTLGANVVLTLLLGVLASFIFPYLGPRILGLTIFIFPAVVFYLNNLIWTDTGLILSLLTPVILVLLLAIFNILYGYVFETRRREQLKEMFGQYVPENHINEMLKSKDKFSLHGEDKTMTVMFADIRNFTTISEGMTATDLVEMLNTYFTPMTEIIHKYIGTVDKYIGDLIMAFWGAPLHDGKHAYHALRAALKMQEELLALRDLQATKKWPEIMMGIGINTGKMSVGDMGSRFRRNYTVLGDAVNLASRVESLTKFYGANILVTEFTQKDQPKFVFRQVDRVQVKGKKTGIDLYELLCLHTDASPQLLVELQRYHAGLNLYFEQRFSEAAVIMNELHEAYPDKKIYSLYVSRLNEYKTNPPQPDWNGTFIHTAK